MYVCILYTSASRIRYTRTPAGVCGLLLSCRRAALIRNERVERAFARVDKGTTAAVAFDIDQLYPALAQMARKYLAIPATAASSERLFSLAGNTVTDKRSRLTDENAENFIFPHSNQHVW